MVCDRFLITTSRIKKRPAKRAFLFPPLPSKTKGQRGGVKLPKPELQVAPL